MADEESGFKVIDRRRFDAEGREREGGAEEQVRSTVEQREEKKEQKKEEVTVSPDPASESPGADGQPAIDFPSFIMSLATQAMMYLGDIKPPDGVTVAVDTETARHMIDVIDMLRKKTEGNLDKDEERFLEEILHNLRLRFIQATQKK